MKMQSDSTTATATAQVPERVPAVERAEANLRAALRLLQVEPLEVGDVVTVEQLIGFALTDLGESQETKAARG